MAIGMGRADAMVDVCEANAVKLAISHQPRFTPGWEKEIVWDLIQDNEALKGSKAYWRLNDLRF